MERQQNAAHTHMRAYRRTEQQHLETRFLSPSVDTFFFFLLCSTAMVVAVAETFLAAAVVHNPGTSRRGQAAASLCKCRRLGGLSETLIAHNSSFNWPPLLLGRTNVLFCCSLSGGGNNGRTQESGEQGEREQHNNLKTKLLS